MPRKLSLRGEIARLVHVGPEETLTYTELGDTVTISRTVLSRLVTHARAFNLLSQPEQAQLLEMESRQR